MRDFIPPDGTKYEGVAEHDDGCRDGEGDDKEGLFGVQSAHGDDGAGVQALVESKPTWGRGEPSVVYWWNESWDCTI